MGYRARERSEVVRKGPRLEQQTDVKTRVVPPFKLPRRGPRVPGRQSMNSDSRAKSSAQKTRE